MERELVVGLLYLVYMVYLKGEYVFSLSAY